MSKWVELEMENRIKEVLKNVVHDRDPNHHFGRPLSSPYQIAIALTKNDPSLLEKADMVIGGEGSGDKTSLSWYISNQLSKRIKQKQITDIEGFYLSDEYIDEVEYIDQSGNEVETKSFIVFRFKDEEPQKN